MEGVIADLERIYNDPKGYTARVRLGEYIQTLKEREARRTPQQNKALHLYFTHLANALNDAGFSVKQVLERKTVDIDWTPESVKELLWRPVQVAALGKTSTTELKKRQDIDLVYSTLNRHLSEQLGLHVAFPSQPEL